MRLHRLWPVMLLLAVAWSGCLSASVEGQGYVVTGQPAMDAFERMGEQEVVIGIPDWAVVDEPWGAQRVGRPFSIGAEPVIALAPEAVLDQAHPLVSGPSREALASGVRSAGIGYVELATEPNLGTVRALLETVEARTGADPEPVWSTITDRLAELNRTVEDLEPPKVLVLFPAGLTAGADTDVDTILDLAGAENVARMAGLEGYRQISEEALRRVGVDLVIATASMRATPEEVASKPFLSETQVGGHPERVLVVDPSRTMRVGPYIDEATWMLAAWLHDELDGPRVHASMEPSRVPACAQIQLDASPPNATVTLLGDEHAPGTITVPDVPEGHYRVRVQATDASGSAYTDLMLSVEGSTCEDT